MCGALRRTALSTAGKLWDDDDFASMKMDEYCKDLEARVGDVAREMGGTPMTGGEGTRAVDCTFGEEISWLEVG